MPTTPLRVATLASALIILPAVPLRAADKPDAKGVEFFEKKIRPVLADQCYRCHSVEAQKAKKLRGGLLLDSRDGVRKGGDGGAILVPGKPQESLLIKALRHEGDLTMPPKGKLPNPVVADFVQWVQMGAPDPRDSGPLTAKRVIDLDAGRKYWAFQPLHPINPPPVRDLARARTPIDRFILARLDEKSLTPNPPASREHLLRRAYFDLLGLPPTPAEIDGFLKDTSADAYERLIDRLLQSERYGERWARHWLDVVRYAESAGYEFDKDRPGAYHYRDFVIKAFNQDMPYDQFVRRQVAGDHLLPGDFLATSATGFLVAGPFPGQTTAKTLEPIRYDQLDDMVATLGTSLLGLSLGCARCHEHKYDPIPQQDYYHLVACVGRTDSTEAKIDPEPEIYRRAKAEFDKAHAPFVAARDRFEKEDLPGRLQRWLQAEQNRSAPAWLILDPASSTARSPLKKLDDGSLLVTAKPAAADTYTIVAHTFQKGITALRLEALADTSLPKGGPGQSPEGGFVLTEFSLTTAPLADPKAKPVPIQLKPGKATLEQPGHALAGSLDKDKNTGWSAGNAPSKDQAAVFETALPIGFDGGTVLTLTLKFEKAFAIGRPRLAITTTAGPALDAPAAKQHSWELLTILKGQPGALNIPPSSQSGTTGASVVRWFRVLDPQTNQVYETVEEHARQEPQPKLQTVFAATSARGGDVHYLIRGETARKNGVAKPGFVQVLMNAPEQEQRWLGTPVEKGAKPAEPRMALAGWLTDTEAGAGHLLARVIVNRLWQHHFGEGIVRTPNDFGVQGEAPTHPELLDWLAGELIRNGWKLKPIHKLIMTSAVYRQSGDANPPCLQTDPDNKLWWRVPPRRLEAEAIRDALLAVSGTLDPAMYGQGTLDENSPRRSIYLTVKRSQLVPLLQLFDAPEPIQSIGERQTTTAAIQALALMNSPFVRQRAEKLAQLIQPKKPDALPQSIEEAYRITLGRNPTTAERDGMLNYFQQQAAGTLNVALADVCQVLLCSNEFLYID